MRAARHSARAIETDSAGQPPHAFRLWRAGWNDTDKGSLNFTPESARVVMADHAARGNPIVGDYEHESLLPLEKQGGAPMRGAASAHADLEVRPDANGEPELWATGVAWTPEAQRQIITGERRQVSPVSSFDTETKEIVGVMSFALCREGATHNGTLLASVSRGPMYFNTGGRGMVSTLIASAPEFFDSIDRAEHLTAADPAATRSFIASSRRRAARNKISDEQSVQIIDMAMQRGIVIEGTEAACFTRGADGLTGIERRTLEQSNARQPDPNLRLTAADFVAARDRQAARGRRGAA